MFQIVILGILIKNILVFHPYETSYFNSVIGGIKGAWGKFDIDFWGTPQKEAALYVNRFAKPNASVYIPLAQSSAAMYLRDDLVKYINTKAIYESDYAIILNRESLLSAEVKGYLEFKQKQWPIPSFVIKREDVPLVWVFQK